MLYRSSALITILTLTTILSLSVSAQSDTLLAASSLADTIVADSVTTDTIPVKKKKQAISEPVFYSANDSMSIVVADQIVLLWGTGKIEYQDIELTADHIISDLENQEVNAVGSVDTSGVYIGKPLFKKGNEEFNSDSILYNINSGKGIIYNVRSEQSEGVLHSDMTKRDAQGHIHMKGGKYTTCEADHPHFYMELTKAIAIPDDKIISGPAYLVVEDVPIPLLGLPFGFFPSSNRRGAGVIIPKYGEEVSRGFYLRNGGWYQPLGQYADVSILGDYYSKGSWAAHVKTSYKVRYKFSGNSTIDYNVNRDNSANTFKPREDFRWAWTHRQDAKANPTQTFAANVNFSSSGFDRTNSYDYNQVLTNQKSSSISFTKSFPGTPFNLSISANARQNTGDSTLVMDLPKGSFNASTIYPFRSKVATGKLKWYENVGFSYNSEFQNNIDIRDTMLFYEETWQDLNYGFKHTIPLSISLKTDKIKMLTISPALSYTGVMNSWYTKKYTEYNGNESYIVTDTIRQTTYAHAINPSISVGLTPKVTGMFMNKNTNSNVIAFRHVMQPRATFSYVPDMDKINPDYYDKVYYVEDGVVDSLEYSYYDQNLYKAPTFSGQSGSLGLGLSNNLEMKLKPKNDTTGEAEPRKVVLLRSFNFTTSYNPFAEEYNWSNVNFTSATSLFKNKLSLNFTSRFSPYDYISDTSTSGNVSYQRVNEFYFDNGKGVLRFTSLNFSTSFTLKSKQGDGNNEEELNEDDFGNSPFPQSALNPDYDFDPSQQLADYVDFSIPWSLRVSYTYSINRPFEKEDQTITNTVNFRGDFSLTPKTKIGFNSGYDIEAQEVTMTNINIRRDLHCWEMGFSMTPFGTRKNYSFYINAKASILRDLKYDKRESWFDNL